MAEPRQGLGGAAETVMHTSVATFHNNLVTRPTGRAVRAAIEGQLQEGAGTCLSLLDFTQVDVIDFSCADEIVGQLLRRYLRSDRPCEAYFIAGGVAEHHRDLFETVLSRHKLLLVAMDSNGTELWGPAPRELQWAWSRLEATGLARADDLETLDGMGHMAAAALLEELAVWRVAIPKEHDTFSSLPAVARRHCQDSFPFGGDLKRVAEHRAAFDGEGAGAGDQSGGGGSVESPLSHPGMDAMSA